MALLTLFRGKLELEESSLTSATLFSCQRNEGPFLIEWIAYHRLIGFNRIIIYSNDCTDGSDKILDRMQDFGLLQHIRHNPPSGSHIQTEAMQAALETGLLPAGGWLLWLDADEFLNIHVDGGHLSHLMNRLGGADGIRFNWRCFGDDGKTPWNGFQIDPAYCRGHRRYSKINRHVKTLYRFDPDNMYPYAHGPVLADEYVATNPTWLDGSGKALKTRWLFSEPLVATRKMAKSLHYPAHHLGQINHYMVRNLAIYPWRRARGRGSNFIPSIDDGASGTLFTGRNSAAHLNLVNSTAARDRSVLRHLEPLRASIAELMQDQVLLQLHKQATETMMTAVRNPARSNTN